MSITYIIPIVSVEKERGTVMVRGGTCKGSTRLDYFEVYWPCAGGLSAVNAIGTQWRDLINYINII